MDENKPLKYIYFIYGLEENRNLTIKSNFSLTIKSNLEKKNDRNISFKLNLYEIAVDKVTLKQDKSIYLYLHEKDSKIGEYLIDIIDKCENVYLLNDIIFKYSGFLLFLRGIPNKYDIKIEEKYEIFRKICDKEKKLEDLIYFTDKYLENSQQYDLCFFTNILKDIKNLNSLINHIELFDLKKVILESKIEKDKTILDKLNFIIKNIDIRNVDENKITLILLFMLIIFSKVDKDCIKYFFNNKDCINFIYNILLEDKNKELNDKLFKDLKLPFDIIDKLIKYSKNYKDILSIISYNDDFYEILKLINENFDFIISFLKKEKNKLFGKIKFQNLVEPKKPINLNKVKMELELILIKEKDNNIFFIEIPSRLLKFYITKNEKNINQLICLYQIIQIISKSKHGLKYIDAINAIDNIFKRFISEKKLINTDLLNYIEITSNFNKILDKNILDNIQIDKIGNEFIKIFKKINWCKSLNIAMEDFVKIICEKIEDIKYFGKLLLLFNFNKEDINKECMEQIKQKFIDLYPDIPEEEYDDYIDDCTKLIYYLNIKNHDLKTFIEEYFYNFFKPEYVHKVYYNLYSKSEYNIIHQEIINCLKDFYNKKRKNNFIKSTYLAFEIEFNENFDPNDLEFYYFIYDDFFDLTQGEKFDFLDKIIKKKLLDKNCLENYVEHSKKEANEIINKIKDGYVEYHNVKKFFDKKKENKLELKNRIEILIKFIDKYEENKNLFFEIEKKMYEINKIINDLNIVHKKMSKFFPKERKEDMRIISNILSDLTSNNIDYYLKDEEKLLIQKYLNIKEINELPLIDEKSNIFFKIIFEKTKKEIQNEKQAIDETKNKINILANVINEKEISEENINLFNQIMNEINEDQYKNLEKEIEDLIQAKMDKEEGERDEKEEIEKLLIFLKYIWKKYLIYNFSILFRKIIEKEHVKKSEFYLVNNTISKNLKSNKKIKVIQLSIDLYKNYNIEFNEETNFNFFKNIKLIKNVDEIVDFLINSNTQSIKNKLNEYEENNYYDYNLMIGILSKLVDFKIFLDSIISDIPEDKNIISHFMNELFQSKEYQEALITLIDKFILVSSIF